MRHVQKRGHGTFASTRLVDVTYRFIEHSEHLDQPIRRPVGPADGHPSRPDTPDRQTDPTPILGNQGRLLERIVNGFYGIAHGLEVTTSQLLCLHPAVEQGR